jgi:predicted nucleic acid-binding protein
VIYLLDTNVVSDMLVVQSSVTRNVIQHHKQNDILMICRPVYYELLRGLFWRNAHSKLKVLHEQLIPLFVWNELSDNDWEQAARFWSDSTSKGRQLSDVDLLLGAMVYRLGATLVTADDDFDVLPIAQENWR